MLRYLLASGLLCASALNYADDHPAGASGGAIRHAPISVMGDHAHATGEWMFSYRYMHMEMDGLLDGTQSVSAAEVTGTMMMPGNYMVAPVSMDMDMHMLGAMYAPSDEVTLMFMLPYLQKDMAHITRMGARFNTRTSGVGDAKASALVTVFKAAHSEQSIHLNLGVSLPSGSIDERDDTPAQSNAKLPYSMQLGSGTLDLMPGVTYQAYRGVHNWGAQLMATIRTESNDNDYRLGNEWQLSSWMAHSWSSALSTSMKLSYRTWDGLHGQRSDLNPAMVPTADPSAQGGERADLALGANYLFTSGALKNHRLSAEYALPVYLSLDGPQMETESVLTLGWQLAL
ncbi:MAG: transporter [Spongiibacteraceae bacterium]